MALGDELLGLLSGAAGKVFAQFTPDDKLDLETYARALAEALLAKARTKDPTQIATLERQIGNYKNAIHLMADKYALAANDEASKALMQGLKLIAERTISLIAVALGG
jgi:hypothetical protein